MKNTTHTQMIGVDNLVSIYQRTITYFRNRPTLSLWIFFIFAWGVASYIFFLRSPNNFTSPNFYAEDGIDFLTDIITHGFINALIIPFNGYFIIGLYLIGDLAMLIDQIFFGGEYIHLPKSIALASYIFLGFCAALPILTLHRILKPAYLALVVFGLTFVAMPLNDNVVIGTLGNLKFAFAFIAILLIAKRWTLARNSKLIPILDIGILLCAYTTATVYLIMPFYLLCDGLRPRQLIQWRDTWRNRNISLFSALGVGVILCIQIIYVIINGIPKIPGYLDSPFDYSKTIEIFLARSTLFGLMPMAYRYLNDILAVVAGLMLIAGIAWSAKGRQLALAILCVYTALGASILFLMNRPGLSGLFQHYKWSGPDQFFYAQTMMTVLLGGVLLQAISSKLSWKGWKMTLYASAFLLLAVNIPTNSFYGRDKSWETAIGTIYTEAKAACKTSDDTLRLDSYPVQPWHVIVHRSAVCTKALIEYPTYHNASLGLEVRENQPVDIVSRKIIQRFPVDTNVGALVGVQIFFSTYQKRLKSDYRFSLYESDCKTAITNSTVDGGKLLDNSFYSVRFRPVSGTANYCFSITPIGKGPQPLAIQISSANPKQIPPAIVDGSAATNPVTFSLIYQDK